MFSPHHNQYYLPSLSLFSPQQYLSAQYHPLANPPTQHIHPQHQQPQPQPQPPHHHHHHQQQQHQHQHLHHPTLPHHHQSQQSAYHHHHQQHVHSQAHVLAGPIRTEPLTRKRPKYTRSKTGCLTCRVKKIKCDESKPICTRCSHGQRECTWPENVPSRKKPLPKKSQAEQAADERSPSANSDNASPASSSATPAAARDPSPSRRSPLCHLGPSDPMMSGRRTHSEPNTATGSPMGGSPIEPPPPVLSRRSSQHQQQQQQQAQQQQQPPSSLHNNSMPYNSSSPPIRQLPYPSISPPSVSPASFHHHSPTASEYPSYTNSPISSGHGQHTPSTTTSAGAPLPPSRHDLPSIQTNNPSRLSNISVDPAHNMGPWHTAPMMSSSVDAIEPFVR